MTLVNRVSAYFLGALAIVLAICAAACYLIVRHQLNTQFDERLYGALHTLVAAVEVELEEAKWQPTEHAIRIGVDDEPETIRWIVIGDGQIVESSRNSSAKFIEEARVLAKRAGPQVTELTSDRLEEWRFLAQRRTAPAPSDYLRELDEFDEIIVVVGKSTGRLAANLRRLAILVMLLPLLGWLAAAAAGRWLCRRALEPVSDMARQARGISGKNFQLRMPVSPSGDELTDLAVAFNQGLDALQNSYEAQRRFTSAAAHELRNPLSVLLGQIEVAMRKPRTPDEYRATLGTLHGEAVELREVLESLLFLARADEDSLVPETEHVELGEWLREYVARWQSHPRGSDIRLEVEGTADVVVSPGLMRRLFDNLLENALKYSPEGSPVIVRLAREGEEAVVAVIDQGTGIVAEDQGAIFEPFYRSHAARTAGIAGTGLGLAIASRIAAALLGRLTCESTPGQGSTFRLWLPARPAGAAKDKVHFS